MQGKPKFGVKKQIYPAYHCSQHRCTLRIPAYTYILATRWEEAQKKLKQVKSYIELPQALFQCGILIFSKSTKSSEASLIGLSIFISLASLVFQMLQLNALTKKESYPSVPFNVITRYLNCMRLNKQSEK